MCWGSSPTVPSAGSARVETELSFPLPRFNDIRYRLDLAGGALMDAGCYAVHCLRQLGPGEPEVISARAKLRSPGVDRAMTASLRFPGGAAGRVTCSMWSRRLLGISARVFGDAGELSVFNFVAPHVFHRLSVRTAQRRWHERVRRRADVRLPTARLRGRGPRRAARC